MSRRRNKRERRWDEDLHVKIASGVTILLIASLVYVFGWVIPPEKVKVTRSSTAITGVKP